MWCRAPTWNEEINKSWGANAQPPNYQQCITNFTVAKTESHGGN